MGDLIVTALEVVALALFAVAVAVFLWRFDPAAGLAGAGVVLLAESAIVSRLSGSPGEPE